MKRLMMMAAVVLLWAGSALGSGGIWNMKQGDVYSKRNPASTDSVEIRTGIGYNAPAGIMQLHPGIYLVGSELSLPDSIEIRGDGPGKTIVKHSGTTLHRIFSSSGKKKIVLRDLTIDGDMLNVSSYPADRWDRVSALDFVDCEDVELNNVEIRMTRGNAIHGARLIRYRLINSHIHDTDGWGSMVSGAADVIYQGNQIERIWGQGLTVDSYGAGTAWYQGLKGSRRAKFLGNTILTVFKNPLHADEAAAIAYHESDSIGVYDGLISGNIVRDSEALGITLNTGERNDGYGDSKTIVTGNTVEGTVLNAGVGIELIGTNFTVSNNTLKNNKYGVTMQDARNVTITGNQFITTIGSSQIGVITNPATVADDVQDVTINGNQFYGGTGFQSDATSTTRRHSGFTISGNNFRWCELPIFMQSPINNVVIDGNIINSDTTGVTLGRGPQVWGDGINVTNNYIRARTTQDAVSTSSSGSSGVLTVSGNQILQADEGVRLNAACSVLNLGDNYFGTMTTGNYFGMSSATTLLYSGRPFRGVDVASAANMTLDVGTIFQITGTTGTTSITIKPAGSRVTLWTDAAWTLTDGSNLELNGNFVGNAAGGTDSITLDSDGTNWVEAGRSIN